MRLSSVDGGKFRRKAPGPRKLYIHRQQKDVERKSWSVPNRIADRRCCSRREICHGLRRAKCSPQNTGSRVRKKKEKKTRSWRRTENGSKRPLMSLPMHPFYSHERCPQHLRILVLKKRSRLKRRVHLLLIHLGKASGTTRRHVQSTTSSKSCK